MENDVTIQRIAGILGVKVDHKLLHFMIGLIEAGLSPLAVIHISRRADRLRNYNKQVN